MQAFIARLIPFIMLGVALVALFFGLMLLAYLLVFGAIVGLALFLVSWIKQRFFTKPSPGQDNKSGRIIGSWCWFEENTVDLRKYSLHSSL